MLVGKEAMMMKPESINAGATHKLGKIDTENTKADCISHSVHKVSIDSIVGRSQNQCDISPICASAAPNLSVMCN